jgi:hypothetical protein
MCPVIVALLCIILCYHAIFLVLLYFLVLPLKLYFLWMKVSQKQRRSDEGSEVGEHRR